MANAFLTIVKKGKVENLNQILQIYKIKNL